MQQSITCADASRDINERLAGSVKPTDVFFLIETNATTYGGWSKNIVKQASQSGELAPYLKHLQHVPNAKILFIRHPQANAKNFYIAVTHQTEPKLYHAMLDDYSDLLTLDIDTIAPNTTPSLGSQAMTECPELYAVCTNGKHDICCSNFGMPVYNALLEHADIDKVWQVTHIGGHRLAATLIAFPQGIYYGYLDPIHAEEIAINHRAGYVVNHKYRGRGSYGTPAVDEPTHKAISAAEHHIRETTRQYAIADLRFHHVDAVNEMQWRVQFVDKDKRNHQVTVQTTLSESRLSSCGDEAKPMPVHHIIAYSSI